MNSCLVVGRKYYYMGRRDFLDDHRLFKDRRLEPTPRMPPNIEIMVQMDGENYVLFWKDQ